MLARRPWTAVPLLLALVLAVACGGGEDGAGQGGSTSTTAAAVSLEVVTFNAGLARGFVDLAEVRVDPVAEAIAGLEADVVALQEVWAPEDVDRIRAAAEAAGFTEALFLDPAPETSGEPACAGGELAGTEACVRASCAGVPDDQLADCVLSSCGAEFGGLGETCQTCLGANVGQPLDTVLETCQIGAATYAYEGSFGIGLLSRLPVDGPTSTRLSDHYGVALTISARG